MEPATRDFDFEGHRLVYDEYGAGERVVVLLPGLLFSRKMHGPLAETLAERGHRVVCLDLLGHGDSDRPPEMSNYSMTLFGRQAIALLDRLEVEQAVIGGTSLGANTTLTVAKDAPERVKGMVVEMPVLDNALLAVGAIFTPILFGLRFGEPLLRPLAAVARRVPRQNFLMDIVLDWVRQDPAPSAAVLEGLFLGAAAPHHTERMRMAQPTLVIGHHADPLHPFSDSGMLAKELANVRLIEASSILEWRLSPKRLNDELALFLDDVWSGRSVGEGMVEPEAALRESR